MDNLLKDLQTNIDENNLRLGEVVNEEEPPFDPKLPNGDDRSFLNRLKELTFENVYQNLGSYNKSTDSIGLTRIITIYYLPDNEKITMETISNEDYTEIKTTISSSKELIFNGMNVKSLSKETKVVKVDSEGIPLKFDTVYGYKEKE